jgi:hypothetical protein
MTEEEKDGYISVGPVQQSKRARAADRPLPIPSGRTPFGLGDDDHVVSLDELSDIEFRGCLIYPFAPFN